MSTKTTVAQLQKHTRTVQRQTAQLKMVVPRQCWHCHRRKPDVHRRDLPNNGRGLLCGPCHTKATA